MRLETTERQNQFIESFNRTGSISETAKALGISNRQAYALRRRAEERSGEPLLPAHHNATLVKSNAPKVEVRTKNAVFLVGSDAHYWPGVITTAHKAFVLMARELKPGKNWDYHVVLNGDVIDAPTISRFTSIGWEKRPTLKDELETCADRLNEIVKAARGARLHWTLGNHDMRFETRLAAAVPEYRGIKGIHLKDHFPEWLPSWAISVNNNHVIIKHRWHNGIHAVYNNALRGGVSVVTGHLHSMQVKPWTDYNGTRYGVDTGTLAEPYGEQFINYTEFNAVNWRSGFAVLTIKDGALMPPELVEVVGDGVVWFRGEKIKV